MDEHYENIKDSLNEIQNLSAVFCEYGNTEALCKYALLHKASIQNIRDTLSNEKNYIELKRGDKLEKSKKLRDLRNLIADLLDALDNLLTNIEDKDNALIYQYAKEISYRLYEFNF